MLNVILIFLNGFLKLFYAELILFLRYKRIKWDSKNII